MIFPISLNSTNKNSSAVELNFVDILLGSIMCDTISWTNVSEEGVSWSVNPSARCFAHFHENFLIFNKYFFKFEQATPAQIRDNCFSFAFNLFNLLSSNKSEERDQGLKFFYELKPGFLLSWIWISNNFFNKELGSEEPIKLYLSDSFSDPINQQILGRLKANFNNPAFVFNYNYLGRFIAISGDKQVFLQSILNSFK